MRVPFELEPDDAKMVAKLIRHLNANTSSPEAAEMAVACGWEGNKFPEMFRRLMGVADILCDE